MKNLVRVTAELVRLADSHAPGSLPEVDRVLVESEPIEVVRDCLGILVDSNAIVSPEIFRDVEDVVLPVLVDEDDPDEFSDLLNRLRALAA